MISPTFAKWLVALGPGQIDEECPDVEFALIKFAERVVALHVTSYGLPPRDSYFVRVWLRPPSPGGVWYRLPRKFVRFDGDQGVVNLTSKEETLLSTAIHPWPASASPLPDVRWMALISSRRSSLRFHGRFCVSEPAPGIVPITAFVVGPLKLSAIWALLWFGGVAGVTTLVTTLAMRVAGIDIC